MHWHGQVLPSPWWLLGGSQHWSLSTPSWSCVLVSHYTWPSVLAKKWVPHKCLWEFWSNVQNWTAEPQKVYKWALWKSKNKSTTADPTSSLSSQLQKKASLWIWICHFLTDRFAHRQGLGEISIRLTARYCPFGTCTRSRNCPVALNSSQCRTDILSHSSVFLSFFLPLNLYPTS